MNFELLHEHTICLCNRYGLICDEFTVLGKEKVAIVISSPSMMASVEVLYDGTYDFLAVETDSERLQHARTTEAATEDQFVQLLITDLKESNMIS